MSGELTPLLTASIAFESTLATPVTPRRPVVSDSGEIIAAVPGGENTLAQAPAPAAQPGGAPAAPPTPARCRTALRCTRR